MKKNRNEQVTAGKPALSVLPNGIEKIALSFSGGGFRAAAFSLGCASYLNRIQYRKEPLLHKVKFISSASGGSITNLLLCSMLRQGHAFSDIYTFQKLRMTGNTLMDRVFAVLLDEQAWKERPDKTRNLINAFAIVYDEDLFDGATFHSLHQAPAKASYVVEDTCINTTEFDNGMNFRWGTSGVLGNKYLYFGPKRKAADRVKLGDILASSSCLTGGFEPIMFPRDFSWQKEKRSLTRAELSHDIVEINHYNGKETDASKNNEEITFGFMDGGIDDNQGIYAFELADKRADGHFDLYFPCDVTSNFLGKPFSYPEENGNAFLQQTPLALLKNMKKKVFQYFIWTGVASLLFGGLAIFPGLRPFMLLPAGLALMAALWPILAFLYVKPKVVNLAGSFFPKTTDTKGSWGTIFDRYKPKLLELPLNRLIAMLLVRAETVAQLAINVYLKRIRQISYQLLYADKANDVYDELIQANNQKPGMIDPGSLWRAHIGVTTVYLLSTRNDFMLRQILANPVLAGQKVSDVDNRLLTQVLYPLKNDLREVVDIAAGVNTTLWFDQDQTDQKCMQSLIAAGQATLCFNLIVMAYQFDDQSNEWKDFKRDLIADWEHFNDKPYDFV